MQLNGANNKEHQCCSVTNGIVMCACTRIPIWCPCCVGQAKCCQEVFSTRKASVQCDGCLSPLGLGAHGWVSGFANHENGLCLGAGYQQWKLLDVAGTQPPLNNAVLIWREQKFLQSFVHLCPVLIACEQGLVWVLCASEMRDERRSRESVGGGGRGGAKREPAPITVNFSFPPRKL